MNCIHISFRGESAAGNVYLDPFSYPNPSRYGYKFELPTNIYIHQSENGYGY